MSNLAFVEKSKIHFEFLARKGPREALFSPCPQCVFRPLTPLGGLFLGLRKAMAEKGKGTKEEETLKHPPPSGVRTVFRYCLYVIDVHLDKPLPAHQEAGKFWRLTFDHYWCWRTGGAAPVKTSTGNNFPRKYQRQKKTMTMTKISSQNKCYT